MLSIQVELKLDQILCMQLNEMKGVAAQSVILLYMFAFGVCELADNWNGTVPDGYLLGLKVVQNDTPNSSYHHATLFKIEFDGSVKQLWNYSYPHSDILTCSNLFAVDSKNKLVYLGARDHFLALDLNSGKIKIKIPLNSSNAQYFWSYDYFPEDNAIYGVCTGNSQWNWCRVEQTATNSAHLDYLYHLYNTSEFSPIDYIYYLDKEDQTLWYYPGFLFEFYAVGINYTTGENLFMSTLDKDEELCIVHDPIMNRVFSYIWNSETSTTVGLAELFQKPKPRQLLMKLPTFEQLFPSYFGTCAYDHKTHTMILLLSNSAVSKRHAMPTDILLLDVVHLTYKQIPLPLFREKWDSTNPLTAMKFIPHNE